MSFTEAIRSVFANYATFRGRAPRSEFWWFALFTLLGNFVLGILDAILVGPAMGLAPFSGEGYQPLGSIFSLAIFIPSLAVSVRRLHDTGRSGWWFLVNLVPLIGWLVFLYFAVQPSDATNRHGPPPSSGAVVR